MSACARQRNLHAKTSQEQSEQDPGLVVRRGLSSCGERETREFEGRERRARDKIRVSGRDESLSSSSAASPRVPSSRHSKNFCYFPNPSLIEFLFQERQSDQLLPHVGRRRDFFCPAVPADSMSCRDNRLSTSQQSVRVSPRQSSLVLVLEFELRSSLPWTASVPQSIRSPDPRLRLLQSLSLPLSLRSGTSTPANGIR